MHAARLSNLRIGTIELDRGLLRSLAAHARELGWTLIVQPGPVSADVLGDGRLHAVLVDVALLGPHWDDWLARHLRRLPGVGIVVCTGGSTLGQRIRGLEAGADDWITKPCAVEEIAARLLAVTRARRVRSSGSNTHAVHTVGLEVRPDQFDAVVEGRHARLTRREFDVLMCLAREAGEMLSRERIYREVWGYEMAEGDRALDTAISKLRSKLQRIAPHRSYIHTHRGVGYRFGYERKRQAG
ncbi:MAG TPA: response regulator transcription factor [Solirubrobacteraceae bacterium]|nr:response regulator transcription factor [Solirubrobacteraceae bacterium]